MVFFKYLNVHYTCNIVLYENHAHADRTEKIIKKKTIT